MSLNTPAQLRELGVSLKQKYKDGLANWTPLFNIADLASSDTTDQAETLIHWMDRLPLVRDWTGVSKEIVNISERGFRVPMRDLELTAGLPLKDLERGNKRNLAIGMRTVVQAARRVKHDLVMQALIFGGYSVDPNHPHPVAYTGYDGIGLFGTHPINPDLPTTAQIVLPTTKDKITNAQTNVITTNPMSAAGVQKARQTARTFRDPKAINLGVELNTFIVPPQLKEATYEAIGAKLIAVFPNTTSGAAKENVNATISLLSNGDMVIVWPELDIGTSASQSTWYALDRNHRSGAKPFELLVEKELVFGTNLAQVAGLSESDAIRNEEVLLAASGRMVAYATLWFLFTKNTA